LSVYGSSIFPFFLLVFSYCFVCLHFKASS
jgi:hypothetical protein